MRTCRGQETLVTAHDGSSAQSAPCCWHNRQLLVFCSGLKLGVICMRAFSFNGSLDILQYQQSSISSDAFVTCQLFGRALNVHSRRSHVTPHSRVEDDERWAVGVVEQLAHEALKGAALGVVKGRHTICMDLIIQAVLNNDHVRVLWSRWLGITSL